MTVYELRDELQEINRLSQRCDEISSKRVQEIALYLSELLPPGDGLIVVFGDVEPEPLKPAPARVPRKRAQK